MRRMIRVPREFRGREIAAKTLGSLCDIGSREMKAENATVRADIWRSKHVLLCAMECIHFSIAPCTVQYCLSSPLSFASCRALPLSLATAGVPMGSVSHKLEMNGVPPRL